MVPCLAAMKPRTGRALAMTDTTINQPLTGLRVGVLEAVGVLDLE